MEYLYVICSIIQEHQEVTYFIRDIVPEPVKGQDTQQSEGQVGQPHLVNGVQLKHRATCNKNIFFLPDNQTKSCIQRYHVYIHVIS